MKTIELSKSGKHAGKYFAQVDDEDYDYLIQWNWQVRFCARTQYAFRTEYSNNDKTNIHLHRVIMKPNDDELIDHRDNNGLNCQKGNMRIADTHGNAKNKISSKNSTSKYLGVDIHKQNGKWRAQINISGKKKHIGLYLVEEDAARAYDDMAKLHHKEFANLNFK